MEVVPTCDNGSTSSLFEVENSCFPTTRVKWHSRANYLLNKAKSVERIMTIQSCVVTWLVALGDTLESTEAAHFQMIQETKHEASRLVKYLYHSMSKDFDDVNTGMMLI